MSIDGRLCTGTLFAYPWAMVPGSWLSAVTPVACDAGVVADLRCVEKEFLKRSDELLAEEWDQRWLPGRVLDNVARLTAALQ
jgi:hypothetical protein